MPARVRYYTDPACSASWACEPALRKLVEEFGADLSITYVMGGLARELEPPHEPSLLAWLNRADRSGMPIDPRLWSEGPPRSTYPACMAVKAAEEQGAEAGARYLRVLREGLLCFRRRLDATEALVEEARRAGLDVQRFRNDLESHAIVEAFGADLEAARTIPAEAHGNATVPVGSGGAERLVFPTLQFTGEREERWVFGDASYDNWRAAAFAGGRAADRGAGARPARGAGTLRPDGDPRDRGRLRSAGPTRARRAVAAGDRVAGEARAGGDGDAVGGGLALRGPGVGRVLAPVGPSRHRC